MSQKTFPITLLDFAQRKRRNMSAYRPYIRYEVLLLLVQQLHSLTF